MFSGCHTYALYETLVVRCDQLTSSIRLSSSAEYPFQSGFIKLKRRLKGSLRYYDHLVGTNTDRMLLGVRDRGVHD